MMVYGVYGHELEEVSFFGVYSTESSARDRIDALRCFEEEGEMPYGEVMDFEVVPCVVDVDVDRYL